jgi:hypothetical protein
MKRLLHALIFLVGPMILQAQQQNVSYSISPPTFEEDEQITITFDGASINEAQWNVTNNALYLWSWSYDINDTNEQDCPTNGQWTNSSETNRLTYNAGQDEYSITFIPTSFYNRTGIGRIGFLIKAKDGTGDKKSQDILVEVGGFQVTLTSPAENSTSILNSGGSLNVTASNSGGVANYVLKANGNTIDTENGVSNYVYTDMNITENRNYSLEVTLNNTTIKKEFAAIVNPGLIVEDPPLRTRSGINFLFGDDTKAILAVEAPFKDFVYVAGSFNNWQPTAAHAMKKAPGSDLFWLEVSNLVPGEVYTYQYWLVDETPIAGSPTLVKTADPFSTLILSPFDDPFIPETTFPNLPEYPDGQERAVTVLQTAAPAYNWQVTNFEKPKKEDLIIYEVLVRDFDADRNYQDLIDKVDYFKNLNINAIHLMPVMEFDNNLTWGYDSAFHMALDKFYGTPNKFKELIDTLHQNGIAVILDLVLNHATGRSPLVRMWMNDTDGDGWDNGISSESPYFNMVPQHDYNVFNDFNHQQPLTQEYTRRVIEHWITEYKIDGFRWDLTKGFTQNCGPGSPGGCTDSYQADRVQLLKEYADHSWSFDDDHYVIFEHLGGDDEEREWTNYRLGEGKGIMMWGKMTSEYNQLTMGYGTNADIKRMGHKYRSGIDGPRILGYAESHDEERLMAQNVRFGNDSNPLHDVTDLNVALSRMSALGAISVMIPGPKMIWHFGDLGMDNSIFTCSDGSYNNDGCKLDTKPQPQWTEDWLNVALRRQIYDDWSRLHDLKINMPVFEGDYAITSDAGNLTPRIDIFDTNIPTSELRNVVILSNFNLSTVNVDTFFPSYANTWYDLMDPTGNTTVSQTTTSIPIPAGQFRIFGNVPAGVLSVDDQELATIGLFPNPTERTFQLNTLVNDVEVYDLSGKRVKFFKGNFDQNHEFDVSDLETGVYMLHVQNENGQSMTSKLVKL